MLPAAAWLAPGTVVTRSIVRDDAFVQTTNIPSAWLADIANQYTAQFYVPRGGLSPSTLSLMIVFGPDGTNTDALAGYEAIADARALLVMAVDGYQPVDNSDARSHEYYYCALKALDDLHQDGTLRANAAFVVAGFSGGAKMAMAVGEYGGTAAFRGVMAAGCNQDFASYAQGMLANPTALLLPFVLVNATDDTIVGGATSAVLSSMMQSGFERVSSIAYTGGHVPPPLQTWEQAVDSILVM
jgi:hypothetical protein